MKGPASTPVYSGHMSDSLFRPRDMGNTFGPPPNGFSSLLRAQPRDVIFPSAALPNARGGLSMMGLIVNPKNRPREYECGCRATRERLP